DEDIRRIVNGKNIPEGIGENDFSYIATACVSHPFDFMTKVKKALSCSGNAFISVLTPCPTGWNFPPAQTLKVGLKAVQTGYYPLYEIENGKLTITERVLKRKPLPELLAMQKRFFVFEAKLVPSLQIAVDTLYEGLLEKENK
ncbi:MAG: hypothetical protein JRJ85_26375, partial [Deltaproteobacteria bacterium]|nr:hypothetical protein [Deltaproteobacteria bacterium]